MKTDKHFISYSRVDSSEFVQKLSTDLKANGINVWLDQQDIRGGVVWDVAIQNALEAADSMLIVLSKTSVNSPNVLDEVSYALKNGKRVIPVLKDDCKIPFRLDRIQYIDFRNNYDKALASLVRTLNEDAVLTVAPDVKAKPKIMPYLLIGLVVVSIIVFFLVNQRNAYNGSNGGLVEAIPDTTLPKPDTTPPNKTTTETLPETPPANNPTGDNNGSDEPPATTTTDLFNNGVYKGRYELSGGNILLYITAPEAFPSLTFDVNLNKEVDANVDRSYGIAGGSRDKICAQYLLTAGSSTTCGGAPSTASLELRGDEFIFSIPLTEVKGDPKSRAVTFQVSIYSDRAGYSFFPASNQLRDFTKMYTVNLLRVVRISDAVLENMKVHRIAP